MKGHGVVSHIFTLPSKITFKINKKKQVQYVPQDTKYMYFMPFI